MGSTIKRISARVENANLVCWAETYINDMIQ